MAIIIRWKRWQVLDVYQKEEVTHLPVYRTVVAAVAPQPEKGRTVAIDISPLLLLSISLSLFSSRFYVHTQPSSAARKKKKRNLQLWKMIEISSGWNKHPRQNEIQKFCVSFFLFLSPPIEMFFFLKKKKSPIWRVAGRHVRARRSREIHISSPGLFSPFRRLSQFFVLREREKGVLLAFCLPVGYIPRESWAGK